MQELKALNDNQLNELNTQLTNKSNEFNQLKSEHENQTNEFNQLKSKHENQTNELTTINAELQTTKSQLESLRNSIHSANTDNSIENASFVKSIEISIDRWQFIAAFFNLFNQTVVSITFIKVCF